jgi:hypothetical protein
MNTYFALMNNRKEFLCQSDDGYDNWLNEELSYAYFYSSRDEAQEGLLGVIKYAEEGVLCATDQYKARFKDELVRYKDLRIVPIKMIVGE